MEIREIQEGKKEYMPLLSLADEQEDRIGKYLYRGTMFVLDDQGVKAECVVTDEGRGVLEMKNIAVLPQGQRKGYGRALIQFIEQTYSGKFQTLQVGTGECRPQSPSIKNAALRRAIGFEIFSGQLRPPDL